jgi:hypothetical protein
MIGPSFTLNEWLKHRRISRAQFYRLKQAGNVPDMYGVGRMQRITPDSDAEWVRKQERQPGNASKDHAA